MKTKTATQALLNTLAPTARQHKLDLACENLDWSVSLRSRRAELLVLCARIGFNP